MKKSLLTKTIDDIKTLRGDSEISWKDGVVDILDVLEVFEDYEVTEMEQDIYDEGGEYIDTNIIDIEDADAYIDYISDIYKIVELRTDNTYNWFAPISNHMCIRTFNNLDTGDFIAVIMVHRFGDVRSNYTDEFVLKFDNESEFFEALLECSKYWIYTDKDGINWYCEFDILNEGMEITNELDFCQSCYDIEDYDGFVEYIKSIE